MRQHKILTWTLLIVLSIINFTLAAPAAIRGRPEKRQKLDTGESMDVPGHPPAPSPDLTDILNEGGSTNVPDHAPAPSPDFANELAQIAYADTHSFTPTPDYVPNHAQPPSPDLQDIVEELPPADTPPPHPNQPGPSEDRIPPGSGFSPLPPPSTHPSQPGPTPSQSPLAEVDSIPFLHDSDFWDELLKNKFKRRISGSDAVNLAQKDRQGVSEHGMLSAKVEPPY